MPTPSRARIHEATVVENRPVAKNLNLLTFRAPALAQAFEPGQFMAVAVEGEPRQVARIPLSFSATDPREGLVTTVYMVQGPGTRALAAMEPGQTTTVLGPGGHGWRLDETPHRVLLVAGGVGITPIVAAARALADRGVEFDVALGAQTADGLWGVDELYERGAGHVVVSTDDGTAGARGLVTGIVEGALMGGEHGLVLTCGPEPMMAAVARLAEEYGVDCQVSMERMMTCGFGACATCAVPTNHGSVGACMGGPVFDGKEVQW